MVVNSTYGPNRLTGFYRGEVLLHLTHGYCKIFIQGVYPDEWRDKPELIPPAEQASSLFAGTNNGSGEFTYPNLHSIVWCFFANEDLNYPVYWASSLGGENAFGQYELIKPKGKEVSKRHLITSGLTLIMIYEDGKISAIVETPDRRKAEVDYNNDYLMLLADDCVSARPVQSKVDNNEISNVNCLLVLDNKEYNGKISCSTWLFDVKNEASAIYLSADDINITSALNYTKKISNLDSIDNDATHKLNIISSEQYNYTLNITNNLMQTTELIADIDEYKLSSVVLINKSSEYLVDTENSISKNDSYMFYNNSTKLTNVSSLLYKNKIHNKFVLDNDLYSGFKLISSLSYLSVVNLSIKKLDTELDNHLLMHGENGLDAKLKYGLTCTVDDKDPTKVLIKDNKLALTSTTDDSCDFGLSMKSHRQLTSLLENVTYVDMSYDYSVLASKQLCKKEIVDKKGKTEYEEEFDTKEGKIEIVLKSLENNSYVKLTVSKNGNVRVDATRKITFNVNDKAIAEMDNEGSITLTSKNDNIKLNGNTKIDGTLAVTKDTKIEGKLNVTKDIATKADVSTSIRTLNTHAHGIPGGLYTI